MRVDQSNVEEAGFWPINAQGSLPQWLFSPDYLFEVFFVVGPKKLGCTRDVIRRALKTILRRESRSYVKQPWARTNGDVRDTLFIGHISNVASYRDRIGDVELVREIPGKRKSRRRMQPFAQAIWNIWYYQSDDPDVRSLYEWVSSIAEERAELGDGVYLSAEIIEKAFADESPPVNVASESFARAILLYASLLPPSQARDLVNAAIKEGCSLVSALLPEHSALQENYVAEATPLLLQAANVFPRIGSIQLIELSTENENTSLNSFSEVVTAFLKTQKAAEDARSSLLGWYSVNVERLVDIPEPEFSKIMRAVNRVRTAESKAIDNESMVASRASLSLSTLSTAMNAEVVHSGELSNPDYLLELGDAESIAASIGEYPTQFAAWIEANKGSIPVSSFRPLKQMIKQARYEAAVEMAWGAKVIAFIESAADNDIEQWLNEINISEYKLLISLCLDRQLKVLAGILIGIGAIRFKGGVLLSLLENSIKKAEADDRLVLTKLINPEAITLEQAYDIKRIVIMQKVEAVFATDNFADLSNPALSLSNADIVGKSIADVFYLINSNVDILGTPEQITLALKSGGRNSDVNALDVLAKFICAPVGLSGHFRRLRELGRDILLSPLNQHSQLDSVQVRELIAQIDNGTAEERVFRSYEGSLAKHEKVDVQHRQQLARYLKSARKALIGSLDLLDNIISVRHMRAYDELAELVAHLAITGSELGSREWMEGEVRNLMVAGLWSKPSIIVATDTLNPVAWSEGHSEWATQETCLLAFYDGAPHTVLAIAAKILAADLGGRADSAVAIVCKLLEADNLTGAARLQRDQENHGNTSPEIRGRLNAAIATKREQLRTQANQLAVKLKVEHPEESVAFRTVEQQIEARDFSAIDDFVVLLEIELLEKRQKADKDAAAAHDAIESAELLSQLMRAGSNNIKADADVAELRETWQFEIERSVNRRAHLTKLLEITRPIKADIEEFLQLRPTIDLLTAASSNPDTWLKEPIAASLCACIEQSVRRLTGWTQAADAIPASTRSFVAILIKAYVDFILEQVAAIKEVETTQGEDDYLERILEVDDLIIKGKDPQNCIELLSDRIDLPTDMASTYQLVASSARLTVDEFGRQVADNVASKSWSELKSAAASIRIFSSDEEIARIDEVVDFCRTMLALEGKEPLSVAALDGAIRAVSTAGHSVHRAVSARERLDLAADIISVSLMPQSPRLDRAPIGTKWARIIAGWPELTRSASDASHGTAPGSRLLEQVLSSGLSFDASDGMWTALVNTHDAAVPRANILRFLHDIGQYETIAKLSARYDPFIKAKVEQMLELRGAALLRPDLVPVAESLAAQVAATAKTAPFRNFARHLPTATQAIGGRLTVEVLSSLELSIGTGGGDVHDVSLTVSATGMVPMRLQARLSMEDDVEFIGRVPRLITLSEDLLYGQKDFTFGIRLGQSWAERIGNREELQFNVRIVAQGVTEDIVTEDVAIKVSKGDKGSHLGPSIDKETLVEYYPGVSNRSVVGDAFIGRSNDLERLHSSLVGTAHPSPVLLTGMRRVGKTSLLYAFHRRHAQPGLSQALTVYISIAELRSSFASADKTVSGALFRSITRALGKAHYAASDHNKALGVKILEVFNGQKGQIRSSLDACYDAESLADSLVALAEKVIEWAGASTHRLIIIIDEAESLIVPYNQGGLKRIELEQVLQSFREASQMSDRLGLVISGSNHINVFAQEYKNAFFGSCVRLELEGLDNYDDARKLVYPDRVRPFVEFEKSAVEFATSICAGMPLFMWQLGASSAWRVRQGKIRQNDVRLAVKTLVNNETDRVPFQLYDVLEPIEHMLKLQGDRESDLLWLLLRRVAVTSSMTSTSTSQQLIVDSSLLEIDAKRAWHERLSSLVDLKILVPEAGNSFRFDVPIFAEGFRTKRAEHDAAIRLQRVSK